MKRILVTGVTGRIGCYVAERLARDGHRVCFVGDLRAGGPAQGGLTLEQSARLPHAART
jgi:nucleoside-diphosphate-sugar epimerase